jgi:hypothetical protein
MVVGADLRGFVRESVGYWEIDGEIGSKKRLTLRKKYAKSAAGRVPHHSYNGLTNILGASRFGGQRPSIKVRLDARLPGAERAFLPRLGEAHWAAHSQYLFRR